MPTTYVHENLILIGCIVKSKLGSSVDIWDGDINKIIQNTN